MEDEETVHCPIIEKNENGNQYSLESQVGAPTSMPLERASSYACSAARLVLYI